MSEETEMQTQPTSEVEDQGRTDSKEGGVFKNNNAFIPKDAFLDMDLDEDNRGEIVSGVWHMFLLVLFPAFLIPMSRSGVQVSTVIGITYLGIFLSFLMHIFYFMMTSENIFRIYSRCAVPKDWVGMKIAYANKEFKHIPIKSISEFCAIAGGVSKILLARLGSYAWTIVMMFIMIEAHNGRDFIVHFDLILESVGALGCAMIGTRTYTNSAPS